jgi:hypothetical protein
VLDAVAAGDIRMGANLTGQSYSDHTHPHTSTHSQELADRWYLVLQGVRGPRMTAVYTIDASTFDVVFDQALGNSLSSAVDGFLVQDDGAAKTLSAAVVQTGTRVRLTTSTSCAGVVTVSFGSGASAVGGTLPTASYALPDARTAAIPAEPFFAQAVTDPPTGGQFSTVFSGVIR